MWWAFWDTDERGEQSAEAVCPPLLYCCYCLFRDYKNAVASKHTSSPSLSLPPFSVCRPFSAVLYRLRTLSGTGTTSLLPNWTDQEEWPSLSLAYFACYSESRGRCWKLNSTTTYSEVVGSFGWISPRSVPFRSLVMGRKGSAKEVTVPCSDRIFSPSPPSFFPLLFLRWSAVLWCSLCLFMLFSVWS